MTKTVKTTLLSRTTHVLFTKENIFLLQVMISRMNKPVLNALDKRHRIFIFDKCLLLRILKTSNLNPVVDLKTK